MVGTIREYSADATDPSSISRFVQYVKSTGLARTNRYVAYIDLPHADNNSKVMTSMFCEAVALPGMGVMTAPHKIFGEVREMPYEKVYNQISLTFYIDSDLKIKKMFDRWLDMVINPRDRTVGYYDDYKRQIGLHVVNVDGTVPYKINLQEAYPKSLQDIAMSADSRDTMKLTVAFAYKYWESEQTAGAQQTNVTGLQDPQSQMTGTGYPTPTIRPASPDGFGETAFA